VLEIRLFGGFDLQLNGQPLLIPSRPAQSLLSYLLLNRQSAHRREKLAGVLWPDSPEAVARKNLRQALWHVRKVIDALGREGSTYIQSDDISVAFNTQAAYWLDVSALDGPPPENCPIEELLRIVSAYGGDLLPGFYEDWVLLEREHLNAQFDLAMQRLLDRLVAGGYWMEVLSWGERWISSGHVPEPAYRALMIAHARLGDLAAVATTFQRCHDVLATELGVAPSPQTLELYTALVQDGKSAVHSAKFESSGEAGGRAAPHGAPPPRQNLPHLLTSFVGRSLERVELRRLLDTSRLVTLTGPGGVGKTRLALQVASDTLADFPDGVWLVELASLGDRALVPQTMAAVFDVRATENARLMEALTNSLCAKRLLLLLDNCEHVVEACAELAQTLLSGCPHIVILATSRERLNLAGEIVFQLPPLGLPDEARLPALETLMQVESIRLFVQRATSARPDFRLTLELAPVVAQICRRLDGLPLGIELAATRVRTMGVKEVAGRLDDSFRLLTSGSRAALPRQQTLRATVDWSYGLLSESERALFRRLSVFAGGWSLEAAEAVCADDSDSPSAPANDLQTSTLDRSTVWDLLSELVDKSLVLMEDRQGTTRYRFLETVRQYAHEKLLLTGEVEDRHAQHFRFFARLAAEVRQSFNASPRLWHDRAEAEHDNLRAALAWALQQGDAEQVAWLAINLWWFWDLRGYLVEGTEWLSAVLQFGDRASSPARSNALQAAALLAVQTGNCDRAEMLAQECLELSQTLSDQASIAHSFNVLGLVAWRREDYARAQDWHSQALALFREIHEEALACTLLSNLGLDALGFGDIERAAALCDESIDAGRKLGPIWQLSNALAKRGTIAIYQEDYALARSCFAEDLRMQRELQDAWEIVLCLNGLACIGVAEGETETAVRFWGAAEAMGEALGRPLHPAFGSASAPHIARARDCLGEQRFAQLWYEGRSITHKEALAGAERMAASLRGTDH
jgi:predicted ATPase/DNA-binding SARP family transcriptional activator